MSPEERGPLLYENGDPHFIQISRRFLERALIPEQMFRPEACGLDAVLVPILALLMPCNIVALSILVTVRRKILHPLRTEVY